MSYVFYDLETTGLSKHFDQIIQFAAVRTDHALKEIDRFEVRSRLGCGVVPHPEALCVNGVGIEQLLDPSLPSHYEMMSEIQSKLQSWMPSIFVGYNSIRFDEELLRQALYKCLYPPYLTSTPGCGRADAMNLALDAASSTPESFVVPLNAEGKRSFKLADISRSNGLALGRSHDALSDVYATIELCNRLRRNAPEAWNRFGRFSSKRAVADFIQGEDAFLLTTFWANLARYTPLVWIGNDAEQSALAYCLVLSHETEGLRRAPASELAAALGQPSSPLRYVHTNRAPALTPTYDVDETTVDLGMDIEQIEDLGRAVRDDESFQARVLEIVQANKRTWPKETHVEKRIYEGFSTHGEKLAMSAFHAADWSARPRMVLDFADDRARTLGLRLIAEERHDVLSDELRAAVARDLDQRLRDPEGPLTNAKALELTRKLIDERAGEDMSMLISYRDYLAQRVAI